MRRMPVALQFVALAIAACGTEGPTNPPPADPVVDPEIASVTLAPGDVTFGAIGASVLLSATVRDATGAEMADVPVVWSVVGLGVARIDSTGRLVSVGNGSDIVVAAVGAVADSAVVQVTQIPSAVVIDPLTTPLAVAGRTAQLTAAVYDSLGIGIAGRTFLWTSSDTTVLAIDAAGRVTAVAGGTATITATSGSLTDATTVPVTITGPVGGPITGALVACAGGVSAVFDCSGIDLLSYLPVAGLGGESGIVVNDAWGWTDPLTGAEYAIVGRSDGIAFVDVSDPLNPRYRGDLLRTEGTPSRIWRDLKVYDHHVFVVADGAGAHGMQIFDLRRLRDVGAAPVRFRETVLYTGVNSAHNVAVNEATGYAYIVGSNGGGETCGAALHMVDIRDPANPTFAGCFADPLTGFARTGYTHDVQCVVYQGPDPDYQGNEVCLGANEDALSIADVTDKANPFAISRASYPNVGYAHQGWLTDDHRYFFSNDELDELGGIGATRTMIWDVADLDDPVLVREYLGPNQATDHNLYIRGDRLYQSNYRYGLRVLDIADPANPVDLGFFDTAPTISNTAGFGGAWTSYPFYASGIIVVTSEDEGLFVLKLSSP